MVIMIIDIGLRATLWTIPIKIMVEMLMAGGNMATPQFEVTEPSGLLTSCTHFVTCERGQIIDAISVKPCASTKFVT